MNDPSAGEIGGVFAGFVALLGLIGSGIRWLVGRRERRRAHQDATNAAAVAAEAAREQGEIQRLTARVSDLEDLIDTLRKALDRHLIRESAIASACELLITLAGLVPEPSDAMLRIRARAQQLLEDARSQTNIANGGKA